MEHVRPAALRHASVASGLGLLAAGAYAWLPDPSRSVQLLAAALLLGGLGLPHGALDLRSGKRHFAPRFGALWLPVFASLYLGLALAVVLVWWAAAGVALATFLAVSAWHFGAGDRSALPGSGNAVGEIILRGTLPVAAPILFHPRESTELLALLLPEADAVALPRIIVGASAAAPLYALVLAAAVTIFVARGLRDRNSRPVRVGLEIGVLTGLFAVAPPLLAFSLYFCVWHAPRHVIEVLSREGSLGASDLVAGARTAAGPTLAALAIGALCLFALAPRVDPQTALARVLFIGMAALTVPHMALAAWGHLVDPQSVLRHRFPRREHGESPWKPSGSSAIS